MVKGSVMRTYFKIILSLSSCALILNGCFSKTITLTKMVDKNVSVTSNTSKSWGKIVKADSAKKEECTDCYATALVEPKSIETEDETKYYASYNYVEMPEETNSAYGDYLLEENNLISIQVGAFRTYSGAEHYKKKYTLLNSNYKVDIKTVQNEYEPLYRVRIEGFNDRFEAKEFMDRYGIRNAFLARN